MYLNGFIEGKYSPTFKIKAMGNLEEYCKKHKKVYFIDTDGIIYKYIYNKNHFVKLTHWSIGEERRVDVEDLIHKKLKELKANKANELTNQYWNNLTREWEYNGRKYKVLSIKDGLAQGIDPEKDGKLHIASKNYNDVFTVNHRCYVGLYQNRIVWYSYDSYIEKCVMYKFINIDTISISHPIGHTNKKNIRPIIDCETNEFL